MKNTTFTKSLVLIFSLVTFISYAQQKTGNIVEYFGKEKVNDVKEGNVIHVFKKGLALKVPSFQFNSASFPEDPVYHRFLMNENLQVKNDEVFDINYLGDELKWKEINVDDTNTFNDGNLRSSYVYLTYKSSSKKTVLFEASGHSLVLINGYPHEGDHYDFGWNLIPLELKKGMNVFVLKVGRFPRIRARLIDPDASIQFTSRDMTLPDILVEEDQTFKGGIRVVNSTNKWFKNYSITANFQGKEIETGVPVLAPMSVRKVAFDIPNAFNAELQEKVPVKLSLNNSSGKFIARYEIVVNIKSKHKHHKRTLISNVDGSVQYYSVAPSKDKESENQALFLSVHGASVEAVNQANAYKSKDWGNLIAPTNRRPFGFAWEDWGRLDAIEVLAEAKSIYEPNPQRVYLTGHSMGGHGTWYLGATYPDHFAAIAPCAGYPDLLLYRNGFMKRILEMPQAQRARFGITDKVMERLNMEDIPTPMENMIFRAGAPSRTLDLMRNYLHQGVYVLHGEKDNVVPTAIARDMRACLGKFHNDFTYYEYPDGTHWYGDHSVDWQPIFDFFKQRSIKKSEEIKKYEFYTGSPGVSSKSHFIGIHQQEEPFKVSSFKFEKGENVKVTTDNVSLLEVDLSEIEGNQNEIQIDDSSIAVSTDGLTYFEKKDDVWSVTSKPSPDEKGPHRNGGFKDAFRNNVVFVYATQGTKAENDWYYQRAKFDAETFWYRANGNVEVVRDIDFSLEKYADRNVIVYGNKDNNKAWDLLLNESPIQVSNNTISFGIKTLSGNQWGLYFIRPRKDSDTASVGVVSATGVKGMKAAYMNHYLVNGTTFPDALIFDDNALLFGDKKVKCAGFFGNDWSIENGEFEWQ